MRPLALAATLFAASLVAATLVTNAANAQAPADPAAAARAKLIAADANKDGKWDKPEWLAAGRREMGFSFCDTSKDGFVDPAELKICAEKARAMGMTGNFVALALRAEAHAPCAPASTPAAPC